MLKESPSLIEKIAAGHKKLNELQKRAMNHKLLFTGHLKRQPGLPGRRSRIVGIKVKHTRLYDHFVSIGIIEISKIKTASLSGVLTGPKVFTSPLGTYIADQIKNRESS